MLSGAGVSTDSGIPDYRGDADAPRRPPITYREFVSGSEARRRYWARSHRGWKLMAKAIPNPCHRAVAVLEEWGLVTAVITQNVDGLHQAGGSREVVELHGTLSRTVCLGCGDRRSRLELQHRLAAANPALGGGAVEAAPDGDAEVASELAASFVVVDCLACGGILKPDVVFFGENVPVPRVRDAYERVESATSVLVLGSSLTVMSGYRFVIAARRAGLPVAIVNRGPTRGDEDASVRVEAGLAEVLGELVRDLRLRPTG